MLGRGGMGNIMKQAQMMQKRMAQLQEWQQLLYDSCTVCGRCSLMCPMGIDIAEYKILAFVLGSFLAGLAGGLYAHVNGFLHPDTFNFIKSFDPMIIIVFGGLGSITGTVFAAFAWALVLEGVLRLFLPQGFETWRFVVYPLLLLITMLLRPKGILGDFELPFLRQVLPKPRKTNPTETEQSVEAHS